MWWKKPGTHRKTNLDDAARQSHGTGTRCTDMQPRAIQPLKPKTRALHDEDKVDFTTIRIGKTGDPTSIRKVKRSKMKLGFLNRVFRADIDFLQVRKASGATPGSCIHA
jgi:hypothetical protein